PVYLMRLVSALLTGALIATAVTALQRSVSPTVLGAGVVVAVTPMVLFLGGVVNPGGTEIAAALAFWVCGLVLTSRATERVENWLVTGAGIAGCVLALSRPLGPLWIALIALTILGVADRAALRSVARSRRARLWAAVIGVPIVVELTPYHADGALWFGNYTLPLAVGVPILAAFMLASTERGRELVASRFVLAIGVVAGVGQFLAFADNLRRYTVGATRDLLFWFHAEWLPPLPPVLLTVGYAGLTGAFLAWVLGRDPIAP